MKNKKIKIINRRKKSKAAAKDVKLTISKIKNLKIKTDHLQVNHIKKNFQINNSIFLTIKF